MMVTSKGKKKKSSGIVYKPNSYYKEQEHVKAIWCEQVWVLCLGHQAYRGNIGFVPMRAASTQGTVLARWERKALRTKLTTINKWINTETRTYIMGRFSTLVL